MVLMSELVSSMRDMAVHGTWHIAHRTSHIAHCTLHEVIVMAPILVAVAWIVPYLGHHTTQQAGIGHIVSHRRVLWDERFVAEATDAPCLSTHPGLDSLIFFLSLFFLSF